MNRELEQYIERTVIPRYEGFDRAHGTEHVRTVIARSLALARHYDVSIEMVYAVAAYHDTGLAFGSATTSTPVGSSSRTGSSAAGSRRSSSA